MTVPTEVSEEDFDGDAAATAFPVPFGIQADENLVVTLLLDGETVPVTQVLGTDYSVAGAGGATCTVNMVVAPPLDSLLHVERTVPIVQNTALRQAGPYSARTHERAHDYGRFVDQQLDRRLAVVEALGDLVPTSSYSGILLEKQFTTNAVAVEDGFPLTLDLPAGFIPTGLNVVKVVNVTDGAALFYTPVWAHWELALVAEVYSVTLLYITGLEPGTEYLLTFEVLSEAVTP